MHYIVVKAVNPSNASFFFNSFVRCSGENWYTNFPHRIILHIILFLVLSIPLTQKGAHTNDALNKMNKKLSKINATKR